MRRVLYILGQLTDQDAECFLVLDRGRIVQSGSHARLMDQPGLFRELGSRRLA